VDGPVRTTGALDCLNDRECGSRSGDALATRWPADSGGVFRTAPAAALLRGAYGWRPRHGSTRRNEEPLGDEPFVQCGGNGIGTTRLRGRTP
jgi:hypothetical protein